MLSDNQMGEGKSIKQMRRNARMAKIVARNLLNGTQAKAIEKVDQYIDYILCALSTHEEKNNRGPLTKRITETQNKSEQTREN